MNIKAMLVTISYHRYTILGMTSSFRITFSAAVFNCTCLHIFLNALCFFYVLMIFILLIISPSKQRLSQPPPDWYRSDSALCFQSARLHLDLFPQIRVSGGIIGCVPTTMCLNDVVRSEGRSQTT